MIKHVFLICILMFSFSCVQKKQKESVTFRNDFSASELKIVKIAREIIEESYFATVITLDKSNQSKARIMEPFAPDENFIIWLATNPKTRKVIELSNNSQTTLHYFDKSSLSYVSLIGNAFLVNDENIKSKKFKKGWERFYKNQKEAYLLIKFIPKSLELISLSKGFNGDSINWKPHIVHLRMLQN